MRLQTEKVALPAQILITTFCSAIFFYVIFRWEPYPLYPDFIVGFIALTDGRKFADLIAAPGLVLVSFFVWHLLGMLSFFGSRLDKEKASNKAEQIAAMLLALWAVVVAVWAVFCLDGSKSIGSVFFPEIAWNRRCLASCFSVGIVATPVYCFVRRYFIRLNDNLRRCGVDFSQGCLSEDIIWVSGPALLTCAGGFISGNIHGLWILSSLLAALFLCWRAKEDMARGSKNYSQDSLRVVLCLFFAGMIPYEIALVRSRLQSAGDFGPSGSHLALSSFGLSCLVLAVACWLVKSTTTSWQRLSTRLSFICQLGNPLLLLCLLPLSLTTSSGNIVANAPTIMSKATLAFLMAGSFGHIIWVSRQKNKTFDQQISPMSVFCLLVFFGCGAAAIPSIPADDYHFGESLLGWWNYGLHKLPFLGYVPAHGLLEDAWSGVICKYFYDGTAASMGDASRMAMALIALPAFLMFIRQTKSLQFSFLSCLPFLVTAPQGSSLLFLGSICCLWLDNYTRARWSRLLAIWLGLAPFVILAVPGQGVIITVCFGLVFCHDLLAQRLSWSIAHAMDLLALLLWGIFLTKCTPIASMLGGSFLYVLANGPVNQLTYGIPWSVSWHAVSTTSLIIEIFRSSWIVVFALFLLQLRMWRRSKYKFNHLPLVSAVFASFCLLASPYIMGRIDPGSFSRMGFFSVFVWAMVVPLSIFYGRRPQSHPVLWLLCFVAIAGLLADKLNPARLEAACAHQRPVVGLTYGANIGFPKMGTAIIEPGHLQQLKDIKEALDEVLLPTEPYLDLTGRNANHFYLQRKSVISTVAPYNMGAPSIQQEVLRNLITNPAQIALFSANNIIHDGGSIALRSPLIYRYILNHFKARKIRGLIVGDAAEPKDLQHRSEEELQLLDEALSSHHFNSIPISWGRSEKSLRRVSNFVDRPEERTPKGREEKITLTNHTGPYYVFDTNLKKGNDGVVEMDLVDLRLQGHKASMLALTWACLGQRGHKVPVRGFFTAKYGKKDLPTQEFDFFARSGRLILPLDSMVYWRLADEIRTLRFEVLAPDQCLQPAISDIAFFSHVE